MIFFELLVESLRNLARHKMRSFLTALGIMFGIASVMAMIATGEGARRAILAQIQELGMRNVIVNAKKPPEDESVKKAEGSYELSYGLTFRDAGQIDSTLPAMAAVLPVHDVTRWIWLKSRRLEARIRGVTAEYFSHLNLEPVHGRTLTPVDDSTRRRVCVVRQQLLRDIRYVGDPLQLDLKIGSEYFRVIGVLPDLAFQSPNRAALGIDDRALEVYAPFHTLVDRFGLSELSLRTGSRERTRVELHQIVCAIAEGEDVMTAALGVQNALARLHDRKDYEVVVPLELLESRRSTQKVFDIVLPVIAGISLLVGGIGVLNIMLASVIERTREIGIRRAVGASRADITCQFLVETVALATIGGGLGVSLGAGFVSALRAFTEWEPAITPEAITLAMAVSCLTGVVFGIRPAREAARMDPIQALRHE